MKVPEGQLRPAVAAGAPQPLVHRRHAGASEGATAGACIGRSTSLTGHTAHSAQRTLHNTHASLSSARHAPRRWCCAVQRSDACRVAVRRLSARSWLAGCMADAQAGAGVPHAQLGPACRPACLPQRSASMPLPCIMHACIVPGAAGMPTRSLSSRRLRLATGQANKRALAGWLCVCAAAIVARRTLQHWQLGWQGGPGGWQGGLGGGGGRPALLCRLSPGCVRGKPPLSHGVPWGASCAHTSRAHICIWPPAVAASAPPVLMPPVAASSLCARRSHTGMHACDVM